MKLFIVRDIEAEYNVCEAIADDKEDFWELVRSGNAEINPDFYNDFLQDSLFWEKGEDFDLVDYIFTLLQNEHHLRVIVSDLSKFYGLVSNDKLVWSTPAKSYTEAVKIFKEYVNDLAGSYDFLRPDQEAEYSDPVDTVAKMIYVEMESFIYESFEDLMAYIDEAIEERSLLFIQL